MNTLLCFRVTACVLSNAVYVCNSVFALRRWLVLIAYSLTPIHVALGVNGALG